MKKWIIAASGLSMALLGMVILLLISCGSDNNNYVNIYHFNPTARQLEAESRPLPVNGDLIEVVVAHFYSGPRTNALSTTWPTQLAPNMDDLLTAVMIENEMLLAFFTSVYYEMLPLEQTLFRGAFIHTMESMIGVAFPSVSDIMILVTDDHEYAFDTLMLNLFAEEDDDPPPVPWLIYDGSLGIYNDPFLSRALIAPLTFRNLHFVDETGLGLIVESYDTDEIDHDMEERVRHALYLLISGFRPEGAMFPIPAETIVLNVMIDGGEAFVNLSEDFEARFNGDRELAELMIYSIVNTLILDFQPVNAVVFLIDTQLRENFHGIEDFHMPFTRNDTLLLSYILEREAEEIWEETE